VHLRSTALRSVLLPALLAATVPLTGCIGDGILLTPVSTKRDLVETEMFRESFFARDKIALIDVSGILLNAPKPELFGEGEHSVSLLLEQLQKAREDDRVKAVLLRINSPGGTVTASELMHDEVIHFRKASGKPVIAYTMDVAASGGYYVACGCDEIIAHPSSVTGSIGVMMQMFDVSGTLHKIGVSTDAITSGPRKDAGSPFRPLEPEERALFQEMVNDMYGRFVTAVADGRPGLDEENVRAIADGRVYTAQQALELGLIDRIATLRQAIALTKKRAHTEKIKLVAYHRPLGYRPNYYAQTPAGQPPQINVFNIDMPRWLDRTTPRFLYLWSP
jgi:protease-4